MEIKCLLVIFIQISCDKVAFQFFRYIAPAGKMLMPLAEWQPSDLMKLCE